MTDAVFQDPLVTSPAGPPAAVPAQEQVLDPGSPTGPASRGIRPASSPTAALRILASIGVAAAIYLGRPVLVPLAMAAFFAFLLAPIANAIEKLRVPRAPAAVASVLALTVALLAVVWESGAQAVDLARRLPEYRKTLDAKFAVLRSGSAGSPIVEATARIKELENQLSPDPAGAGGKSPTSKASSAPPGDPAPVSVRIVTDERTPLDIYGNVIGSALGPLGDAAIVVLLAIILLSCRSDVRERLLALGSARRIGVTSQALDEASRRVGRYLLTNLAVNTLYGTAIGIGVFLIGLPNAWLWGLLCALLRFVPYIGTWIGAVLPIAVSIAVFDGWGRTGAVFATIIGIDLVIGNVIEPVVYGHRTGLSPLAVVLATIFWTWAWGVPGLLLAIPMTLCLAVIGRYVPGFGVFHVLLGDESTLDPAERAYERLIAFDPSGASKIATDARGADGRVGIDDRVLLAALRRAERDRREGQIDGERYLAICDGVREAFDDGVPAPAVEALGSALCLPAFGEADRVACEMLVHHLATVGVVARVGDAATTTSGEVALAVRDGVACVLVVALPPFAGLRVRYGIRRARSQAPAARFVGVVLDPEADRVRVAASLRQAGASETRFSLAETLVAFPSAPAAPIGNSRGHESAPPAELARVSAVAGAPA